MSDAFFTLYSDLDREGPGEDADVTWVAEVTELPRDARICDAGCGSGANVPALLAAAPEGHVTAIDRHKPFIDELLGRIGLDKRVTAYVANMAKLKGPYDLIFCAGALYFLGIEKALGAWRPALAKEGHVAFSEPCLFAEAPSPAALAFWGDDFPITDAGGIDARVRRAGFETVATRRLSDAAWEAYYTPLERRIAALRPTADEALRSVLEASQTEIDTWRGVKDETGYLLSVVRPA